MATNLQGKRALGLGKRLANQIWTSPRDSAPLPLPPALGAVRRGVHSSVYDKNPDEPVRASAVPDDVIGPPSDKYWSPDPATGVFGPANPSARPADGAGRADAAAVGSAMDQAAWFRPVEGVDKPTDA